MYFYLLNNSSLIKDKNNEMKIVKIFIYGVFAYIVTHSLFFIGGNNSVVNSIKNYFWIILLGDIIVIYTIYSKIQNKSIDILDFFGFKNIINNKFLNKESESSSNRIPNIIYQHPKVPKIQENNSNVIEINDVDKIEKNVLDKINENAINDINKINKLLESTAQSYIDTKKEESSLESDSDIDIEAFKKML